MAKRIPLWRQLLTLGGFIVFGWIGLVLVLVFAYTWLPVPATPLMLWRTAQGYTWQHEWTPIKDIPRITRYAAIASEDARFCTHTGVDWEAVEKVYNDWQDGGRLRGASTISMQTARNLFLWPGQDPVRKALEIPLTYLIESAWSKQRIMEIYLNIAEMGKGVYGIGAASQHYYKKRPAKLTPMESFRLIAILPAPLRWSPLSPGRWTRTRANTLSTRIAQLGPATRCVR